MNHGRSSTKCPVADGRERILTDVARNLQIYRKKGISEFSFFGDVIMFQFWPKMVRAKGLGVCVGESGIS